MTADPTNRSVYYNPKYEELYAPVSGPVHPTSKDGLARGATNHKLGMVEVCACCLARIPPPTHVTNIPTSFRYHCMPSLATNEMDR